MKKRLGLRQLEYQTTHAVYTLSQLLRVPFVTHVGTQNNLVKKPRLP